MFPSEGPFHTSLLTQKSSHNYSFSFCPKPDWPGYYATSEQIHGYMKDVSRKYECDKYIKCNHTVQSAIWNETKGKWELKIKNREGVVFTDECDVFVNAGGILKYVVMSLYIVTGA
jgi:cation diffusion facilitator CzcD-associated flavoprotein CzcO